MIATERLPGIIANAESLVLRELAEEVLANRSLDGDPYELVRRLNDKVGLLSAKVVALETRLTRHQESLAELKPLLDETIAEHAGNGGEKSAMHAITMEGGGNPLGRRLIQEFRVDLGEDLTLTVSAGTDEEARAIAEEMHLGRKVTAIRPMTRSVPVDFDGFGRVPEPKP